MKYFLITCFILFFSILNAEEFSLKWSINVKVLDKFEFIDGGNFRVNTAEGSWEDNKGFYGYMKCIGPIIIDKEKNLNLNFMCDGYDNNNDRFHINLKRNSVEDAGIGKAVYVSGTGRYLNFKNKECTYAVKYLNPKVGFYKQICKN
tara:strand:- start:305 stop:745 length:441 start_codon:yes stop_codon:yes gene_type:complete